MSFVMYVIVGIIAGWVATELSPRSVHHQFFSNVLIGTVGSLLGGYVFEILGLNNFSFWESVGTAMVGATIVLYVVKTIAKPKKNAIYH